MFRLSVQILQTGGFSNGELGALVLAGSLLQDRAALLHDLVLVCINAFAEDVRQLLELLCTGTHLIIRVALLCT